MDQRRGAALRAPGRPSGPSHPRSFRSAPLYFLLGPVTWSWSHQHNWAVEDPHSGDRPSAGDTRAGPSGLGFSPRELVTPGPHTGRRGVPGGPDSGMLGRRFGDSACFKGSPEAPKAPAAVALVTHALVWLSARAEVRMRPGLRTSSRAPGPVGGSPRSLPGHGDQPCSYGPPVFTTQDEP